MNSAFNKAGKGLLYLVLWIWTITMLVPLLYMVLNSFKSDAEISNKPFSLPGSFRFDNYLDAWLGSSSGSVSSITLGTSFLNSIIVTVSTLLLLTIVSTLAGYALGRHQFPGNKLVYLLFVGLIAVPMHALLVPIYRLMDEMGMLNNLFAIILIYTTFALPFSVVIMRSYFESIPTAVEEAARIDGCRELSVFWHIGLPMSRGAIATVIIVNVVNIWSELMFATALLTEPSKRTLPLGISLFSQNMYGSSNAMLFASLVMATLPLVVVYFIFQRQIVKGMAMGAVK